MANQVRPATVDSRRRQIAIISRQIRFLASKAKILSILCLIIGCDPVAQPTPTPYIASLKTLSAQSLRGRTYGSEIAVEQTTTSKPVNSYLASYKSDGLRLYTRIDVPDAPQPQNGFPVVIFVHGWTGIERAPTYDLYFRNHDDYGEMIDAYVTAGFVVFTPGWRGHSTVGDVPADGIEFMQAFDNGSYLSPVFYAIDILNLIDGLQSFEEAELDLTSINLSSHSQGGDVALIVLTVAGEDSALENEINAASIWAGTFASRFTQVHTYQPMEKSPEAFMSGDGTWTGTAIGRDGSENSNFVFGYPSDWIETMDTSAWTWQKDNWSTPTVAQSVADKFGEMYGAINKYVGDINDAAFEMQLLDNGSFNVLHDPRVESAMAEIGGFDFEEYLMEPLLLQHSDRDFYTLSTWNADLCARINSSGGTCFDYEYAENTHALRVSSRQWFSSKDAVAGFHTALQRDIALFRQ